MAFNVQMVTFRTTLVMNKFTNIYIVMDDV